MRLIDADEVKKRYPIMENDFGMVVNERLHKELDKIPTVNAVSEEVYTEEYNLRKDAELKVYKLERVIKEIKEEIRHLITKNMEVGIDGIYPNEYVYCYEDVLKIIDKKVKEYNTSNVRECNTCKHSNNGKTNSTETCHECMWDSKYEKVKEYTE